jgi:hypothetical protein
MNSQDASSSERRPPESAPGSGAKAPEHTLKTDQLQIERKTFLFVLRENARGRFLSITEESRGHRDRIIIPAPGLPDLSRVIQDMIKAAAEIPSPPPTLPSPGPSQATEPAQDRSGRKGRPQT